jgi:hypothetical protein
VTTPVKGFLSASIWDSEEESSLTTWSLQMDWKVNSDLLAAEVEQILAAHFESDAMRGSQAVMRRDFVYAGFCKIASLVPETVKLLLYHDIAHCLDRAGRRRDLKVKVTGNSPRAYFSVDRNDIFANSSIIPNLYRSTELMRFLAGVTGEESIIPAPYEPEEVVINCMQRPGDEHGWHWDDYRYSLIWLIKAPRRGNGGEIQFVTNTVWDKNAPAIEEYLATRPLESHFIEEGTAYLIKGDTNMHRVSPFLEEDTRIVSTFSYAGADEADRVVSHETMEELYPEAAAFVD